MLVTPLHPLRVCKLQIPRGAINDFAARWKPARKTHMFHWHPDSTRIVLAFGRGHVPLRRPLLSPNREYMTAMTAKKAAMASTTPTFFTILAAGCTFTALFQDPLTDNTKRSGGA